MEKTSENCAFCQRPKCVVVCGACGGKMLLARVRMLCVHHPQNLFLLDLPECSHCNSDDIREVRKLGWYDESYNSADADDDDETYRSDSSKFRCSTAGASKHPVSKILGSGGGNRDPASPSGVETGPTETEGTLRKFKYVNNKLTEILPVNVAKAKRESRRKNRNSDAAVASVSAPNPDPPVSQTEQKCNCIYTAGCTVCHGCGDVKRNVAISKECSVHPGCRTTGVRECQSCHAEVGHLSMLNVTKG